MPLGASWRGWDKFPAIAKLIGLSFPRLLYKLLRSKQRNAHVNTCQHSFYQDILLVRAQILIFHRHYKQKKNNRYVHSENDTERLFEYAIHFTALGATK